MPPSDHDIVQNAEQNYSAIHQTAIIHILRCDRICNTRREEAEHDCHQCIYRCEHIDRQAPSSERPGPEVDLVASQSSEDHENDRKVGGRGERHYGIECHGRSEIEQSQECVDNACQSNGVERDRPAAVNLIEKQMSASSASATINSTRAAHPTEKPRHWQTAVSRESPCLSRSRCHKAKSCAHI